VNQSAKALGKTAAKIRELCRSGELPAKNLRPNSERAEWQTFEDDINAFGADNDNLKRVHKVTRKRNYRKTDIVGTNPIQAADDLLAEAMAACRSRGRR
jgi:hypothetical protein